VRVCDSGELTASEHKALGKELAMPFGKA